MRLFSHQLHIEEKAVSTELAIIREPGSIFCEELYSPSMNEELSKIIAMTNGSSVIDPKSDWSLVGKIENRLLRARLVKAELLRRRVKFLPLQALRRIFEEAKLQ